MDKERFFEAIRKIPKAELHLHLENFVAQKGESVTSLPEFLVVFRSLQNSLRRIEDFAGVFENIATYMKHNGIVYAEVFFSPSRYLKSGWKYSQMVKFFDAQIKLIKKTDNVTIKLLVDVSRTYGAESADFVLNKVIKYRSPEIIGIGLGGDEKAGPAKEFTEVFKKAKAAGLRVVAHAGEDDGHHSVWDAVVLLEAERIGHGIAAAQCKQTLQLLIDKQIPIEIAPTSNLITGAFVKDYENHPVKKYSTHGAFVTLNTDDPTLFNTSLIREYWKLYSKLNYRPEQLLTIIINGFLASFMEDSKKHAYIRTVKRKWLREVVAKEAACHNNWKGSYMSAFVKGEH